MSNYLEKYTTLKDEDYDRLYQHESLLMDIALAFEKELIRQKVNKIFLAKAVKKNSNAVSRLLRGDTNITMRTLSDFAYALDCRIAIKLEHSPKLSVRYDMPSEYVK